MMFDEICTARSPVCLCLIASGLVFMNGKRLHHRSRKSRILPKKIFISPNDLRNFDEIFRKNVSYDNIKSHKENRDLPSLSRKYSFEKIAWGAN